ncbi:MAG: hypothetical protein ACPIOQ_68605 [Promethearchaeia archaeon]
MWAVSSGHTAVALHLIESVSQERCVVPTFDTR